METITVHFIAAKLYTRVLHDKWVKKMDVFPDRTIVISLDRTRKMEQALLPIELQSYNNPMVTQFPFTDLCAQEDTRLQAVKN